MAIVADLSGNFPASNQFGTDRRQSSVNRNNAGSPVAVLTPAFVGEIVMDTANNIMWMSTGTTNTQWSTVTLVM